MIKFNPAILESKPFAELIEQSEYLTFEKKEIIVQANHVCNYLYLIETGLLRSYYFDLKGNDITLVCI